MQRKRKQAHVMFDWQATSDTAMPLLHALERRITFSVTRVYNAWIQNKQVLQSCVHYVIAKCAFRIKIQNTHFAVV